MVKVQVRTRDPKVNARLFACDLLGLEIDDVEIDLTPEQALDLAVAIVESIHGTKASIARNVSDEAIDRLVDLIEASHNARQWLTDSQVPANAGFPSRTGGASASPVSSDPPSSAGSLPVPVAGAGSLHPASVAPSCEEGGAA